MRARPADWGRGYPAELSGPLLSFGFEVLGLHRMYAHCLAENAAAVYWAEKLGMRQEGRLRENVPSGGGGTIRLCTVSCGRSGSIQSQQAPNVRWR